MTLFRELYGHEPTKYLNYEALQRADTRRITNGQIRFSGHVMRNNQMDALALTGKIDSKRAKERLKKTFWTG